MAELQTNFNVAPFYDDYDEEKQYYRILFRGATAVQARELTQLQTILQRQISRFGNSIYKDGTLVEGCGFTSYPTKTQVRFKDSNTVTYDFGLLVDKYLDTGNSYLLVSNTTGVRAAVFRAFTGAESLVDAGSLDTNRAYVDYIWPGTGGELMFSSTSEKIDVYSEVQDKTGILSSSNLLGSIYTITANSTINTHSVGYAMRMSPGIVYQKGFFQNAKAQNIVVKEHTSNAAGMIVGFDTQEYIVKPSEDPSLYDNSVGSPNYNAPGAYRLKLDPVPICYDKANNEVTIPSNFLPIVEFDGGNGGIVQYNKDPQYSILMDVMAKRTYEESGNYVLNPFQVDVTSHESNTSLFYYNASPGVAYVDGYRVEFLSPRKIPVERAVSSNSFTSETIRISLGSYAEVNEVAGIFNAQTLTVVELYDQPQQTLSLYQSRSAPSGNLIGYANIRGFNYDQNVKGIPEGRHNVYLFNIRMNPGKFFASDVKSLYVNDATYGKGYADFVLDNNNRVALIDVDLQKAIFDTGLSGVKSLVDSNNNNNTTFIYKPIVTSSYAYSLASGGGITTFNIAGPDEFNLGVGYLTDQDAEDVNVIFAQDTLSNTVATSLAVGGVANATSANITHLTTGFAGGMYVGMGVKISNTTSATYNTVSAINAANSITVSPATIPSDTLSIQYFFKKGTHVNFNGSGNTFYVNSGTSVTVNLCIDPATSVYNLAAQIPVKRTSAVATPKVVKEKRYVKIDCGTHVAGTTGPWCLGLTDAYRLDAVYFGTTYDITNSDVIDWFELDNGQTEYAYGLSYLKLRPQYAASLTNLSKLVVEVSHFEANTASISKAGFFSIDSYPIDDANTANTSAIATAEIPVFYDTLNNRYDLRNFIDFRPLLANTAVSTNTLASATENPANNTTSYNTTNILVADPGSDFTYNISYYLPRIDILIIDKDGNLSVKKGTPSAKPVPPSINKTGLPVAEIVVPPYPSLTFKEAE
jgi:hypothetical protein